MFTTPDDVMAQTPYTGITMSDVRQAQFVIETYVGRTESEVDSPRDKALLARATAAQCVYMKDNPDIVFNQVKASAISAAGQMTTFNSSDDAPFIAPLAVIACKKLSWRGSRSVKVGRQRQIHDLWMNRFDWIRY